MSVYQGSDMGGGTGQGPGSGAQLSPPTIPQAPPPDLAALHQVWLTGQQATLSQQLREEWKTSDAWNSDIVTHGLAHYAYFDRGPLTIWRFTSRPASESIQITGGIPLSKIIQVIAAHSGGADKSNPDVKTSSLCRNPGALMGTAASAGGDKKVLNIINRAEYLIGIDVTKLAAHGVSAHPALSRTISLIETEYVLVPTPGLPPYTLDQLATSTFPNPFKGRIQPDGTIVGSKVVLPIGDPQSAYRDLCVQPPQKPEPAALTGEMNAALVEGILMYAAKVSQAASQQTGAIQDKEPPGFQIMCNIARKVFADVT